MPQMMMKHCLPTDYSTSYDYTDDVEVADQCFVMILWPQHHPAAQEVTSVNVGASSSLSKIPL